MKHSAKHITLLILILISIQINAQFGCIENTIFYYAYKGDLNEVQNLINKNRSYLNLQLKESKCELHFRWGQTPLMIASEFGHAELVKYLVSNGADINLTDENGIPAVQFAAGSNHIDIVKFLVEHGAKLDSLSIVNSAAFTGNIQLVRYLIENGADATIYNSSSPLTVVTKKLWSKSGIIKDYEPLIRYLIENTKIDINFREKRFPNETALDNVAAAGDFQLFKYMISKGAIPDTTTFLNATQRNLEIVKTLIENYHINPTAIKAPLNDAATYENLEIIKHLVENFNIPIEATSGTENKTALIIAADHGNLEIVKYLLDNGANINAIESNLKQSVLLSAIDPQCIYGDNRHTETAKYLIQKGADLSYKDYMGRNALDYCAEKNNIELAELIISKENLKNSSALAYSCENGNYDIFRLLVKSGYELNYQDDNGNNLLVYALWGGNIDIVKYILNRGIRLSDTNCNMLIFAASSGNLDLVKYLHKTYNLEIRKQRKCETSALIEAVKTERFNIDLIMYLVDNDANINQKDKSGRKAIDYSLDPIVTDYLNDLK
jgi:ankyrin repeat protein